MRDLPQDLLQHLSKTSLTPVWLLEIILVDGTTFRRCTHGELEVLLGQHWYQSNMQIRGPDVKSGASMSAAVEISKDSEILTSFMTDSWEYAQGKLYFTYYCGTDLSDPKLLLLGDITGAERTGDKLSIALTSTGNLSSITPWIRIAPPTFNWLTARGTVLTWGVDKIVIDRE